MTDAPQPIASPHGLRNGSASPTTAADGSLPFDALIFDMDGTLTDSEHWWDEIRRGLAAHDGRPWPPTATVDMMGLSTREWATYLVEKVGVHGTWPDAAERTIRGMIDRYHSGVPLLHGADAAVRRMAALLPIGICSSSPRRLIDAVAADTGWETLLSVQLSTEEVARGKPHPDGYLRAAELLGADPARCVVVEDSSNGLTSALAAGMAVVAVPPHFHPPAADVLARCDLVIDNLDELTADALAATR